jgi:hypothetical protein
MTMQGVYRKWVGTLPPSLEASATVDALRAICELDLSKLDGVQLPNSFERDRDYPNNTAPIESILRLY